MYYFCTLCDKNYIYKGLALYHSLVENCPDFKLWILCMDAVCYGTLKKINLENVELISLKEFEDKQLKEVKKNRTVAEYCWTCVPSLLLFLLRKFPEIDKITYLDSDLYFFASPEKIYEEFNNYSIMIVPHRHGINKEERDRKYGKFNAGMLVFRNNVNSFKVLRWWRKKCLVWCYNRVEKGKFGSQIYLDVWPEKFSGVHVLQNEGAGVAPWNLESYQVKKSNGKIMVNDHPLVFYHFSGLKIFSISRLFQTFNFQLLNYSVKVPSSFVKLIYQPYIKQLKREIRLIKRLIGNNYQWGILPLPRELSYQKIKKIWVTILSIMKRLPLFHYGYSFLKKRNLSLSQIKKIKVQNSGIIKLSAIPYPDSRGLIVAEEKKEIPFTIKRVYLIDGIKHSYTLKGEHAHKKTEQAIFCLEGSFVLILNDGEREQSIALDNPTVGVKIGKMLWYSMCNFSRNCKILVFADSYYDEADYIREYGEF